MNRAPWQNPRIFLTLFFVFLSGAVAGAVAVKLGTIPPKHKAAPFWEEGGREISIQRFQKELNLTPPQTAEVQMVLDDFVMYYQNVEAQMDDVRKTGKSRILRILKEDQKAPFERMLSELHARKR